MPPREERLRSIRQIDIADLPEDLGDVLKEMRSWTTKEQWAETTKDWPGFFRDAAIRTRAMNPSDRYRFATQIIKLWVPDMEREKDEHNSKKLLLLIDCLGDRELDLAISSFLPKSQH